MWKEKFIMNKEQWVFYGSYMFFEWSCMDPYKGVYMCVSIFCVSACIIHVLCVFIHMFAGLTNV